MGPLIFTVINFFNDFKPGNSKINMSEDKNFDLPYSEELRQSLTPNVIRKVRLTISPSLR